MLKKLKGKPYWYKLWAFSVGAAVIYFAFRLFGNGELQRFDWALMIFASTSIFLDRSLFSEDEKPKSRTQVSQTRQIILVVVASLIAVLAAVFL